MATVSLKRGGGERAGGEGGMEVSHAAAPSKVNGLVSHGSETDLPESTLKSKVSPRWFQQRLWWNGSLERSFKQWGHCLQQRATNRTQKNNLQDKVSIWTPAPIESILIAKRNFRFPFCLLYLSHPICSLLKPRRARSSELGIKKNTRGSNEKDKLYSSSYCRSWKLSQAWYGGEKKLDCMRLWNFEIRQNKILQLLGKNTDIVLFINTWT